MSPPKKPYTPLTRRQSLGVMAFGLVFAFAGGLVEWMTFVFPPHPRDAPLWVVRLLCLVFIIPGLAFFTGGLCAFFGVQADPETHPLYTGAVLGLTLTIFALGLAWVALFGDARNFRGGITGTIAERRIAFGLGALLVGIMAFVLDVAVIASVIARIEKRRREKAGAKTRSQAP